MPQMTEREARKVLGDLPVSRETTHERVTALLLTVCAVLAGIALLLYLAWTFNFGVRWPETNDDGTLASETSANAEPRAGGSPGSEPPAGDSAVDVTKIEP